MDVTESGNKIIRKREGRKRQRLKLLWDKENQSEEAAERKMSTKAGKEERGIAMVA